MTDPFFVIWHDYENGDPMGTAYSSEKELVSDIADGQFEDIQKIHECSPSEWPGLMNSFCRDATEDIARAVKAKNPAPSYELASWLQTVLGLEAAQAAE